LEHTLKFLWRWCHCCDVTCT